MSAEPFCRCYPPPVQPAAHCFISIEINPSGSTIYMYAVFFFALWCPQFEPAKHEAWSGRCILRHGYRAQLPLKPSCRGNKNTEEEQEEEKEQVAPQGGGSVEQYQGWMWAIEEQRVLSRNCNWTIVHLSLHTWTPTAKDESICSRQRGIIWNEGGV